MRRDRRIVSFSGGKDSTAMLLRLLEDGRKVDEIIFFDTGWEFPAMYSHLTAVEEYIGRSIIRLHPAESFEYVMLERPIVARKGPKKGQVHRIGNGWPHWTRRWCTRLKCNAIDIYCGESTRYIGIAADEAKRVKSKNMQKITAVYPLIEWGMTEADCLRFCYDRGFDWGGLYNHFQRVSCFCCPLQRIGALRTLYWKFPELWQKMLDWETQIHKHNLGFRERASVHDLDKRFLEEN